MMSTKVFKHDYNKQADGLARSAFEKPKLLSMAHSKEEDDFVAFKKEDYMIIGNQKVGITVYADRLTKKGGGRMNFSLAGSDLLGLQAGQYITFFATKSGDWAFSIGEQSNRDSLLISLVRKQDYAGKYRRKNAYMCNSKQLAGLLFRATGMEGTQPVFIPFGRYPDEKGRYHLITRLATLTGREKKPT